MFGKIFSALALCTFVASFSAPANGAVSDAEMRAYLQHHPDVILDALKSHSEELFDIVQDSKKKKREKKQIEAWKNEINKPRYLSTNGRLMRGVASAPVTIVVFSDFTCPFCKRGDVELQKLLKQRPKDVKFLFKYFPSEDTPSSNLAAEYFIAASLQNADKAWKFYDLLFEANTKLDDDPENMLPALAEKAGLDMSLLKSTLKSGKKIREILDADISEANAQGIDGTPVFFVNNLMLRGTPSLEQLGRAVDMAKNHTINKK